MAKILITGGSGLIGREISKRLQRDGHQPQWLSRDGKTQQGIPTFKWDVTKGYLDPAAFEGVEHVVHLAGAGIAEKRWTTSYKQEVIDSRVKSVALLAAQLQKYGQQVKSFTGASAVGYYGARQSAKVMTETEPAYPDFLGRTCAEWERAYAPLHNMNLRCCVLRTGIVLSREGGAYAQLARLFRLGVGAAVGTGRQAMPWIHINDMARMYLHCIYHPQLQGTFNAVAPEQVSHFGFCRQLAASLHRPFFLPRIPTAFLKVVLGERALLLTEGVYVSGEKIRSTGFQFEYEALQPALKALAADM